MLFLRGQLALSRCEGRSGYLHRPSGTWSSSEPGIEKQGWVTDPSNTMHLPGKKSRWRLTLKVMKISFFPTGIRTVCPSSTPEVRKKEEIWTPSPRPCPQLLLLAKEIPIPLLFAHPLTLKVGKEEFPSTPCSFWGRGEPIFTKEKQSLFFSRIRQKNTQTCWNRDHHFLLLFRLATAPTEHARGCYNRATTTTPSTG